MAQVFIPNLPTIKSKDRFLGEALEAIVNNLQPQQIPPPPNVTGITVTAANGFFTVQLVDSGEVQRGVHYFVEYDTAATFPRPIPVSMGASRTTVLNLGNQTLFWRAYSQYVAPYSDPNTPIVFGGANPTGVAGGGAVAPPPVTSTGSGTGSTSGQQGGSGFGKFQFRPGITRKGEID